VIVLPPPTSPKRWMLRCCGPARFDRQVLVDRPILRRKMIQISMAKKVKAGRGCSISIASPPATKWLCGRRSWPTWFKRSGLLAANAACAAWSKRSQMRKIERVWPD